MGSYDTGESYSPPVRSFRRDSPSTYSGETSEEPVLSSNIYSDAPILISLGGGLTPSRIVKKLPMEYENKSLVDVVKYITSGDNIATPEERTIADAIMERMRATDYRAVINNNFNYHNDRLGSDVLKSYLVGDKRETEGGVVEFNKADIAIVSHDEGGNYKTLDKLVY